MITACSSPEKAIIGIWKGQNTVLGIVTENVYKFYEDGTGTISTVLGIENESVYSIDGDKLWLTISVLGIDTYNVYTFKINGDTLTLTDDSGTTVLTKQK